MAWGRLAADGQLGSKGKVAWPIRCEDATEMLDAAPRAGFDRGGLVAVKHLKN
jgi:hypothetical protein